MPRSHEEVPGVDDSVVIGLNGIKRGYPLGQVLDQ